MRTGQAETKKGQARDASKDQGESEEAIRCGIRGSVDTLFVRGLNYFLDLLN